MECSATSLAKLAFITLCVSCLVTTTLAAPGWRTQGRDGEEIINLADLHRELQHYPGWSMGDLLDAPSDVAPAKTKRFDFAFAGLDNVDHILSTHNHLTRQQAFFKKLAMAGRK